MKTVFTLLTISFLSFAHAQTTQIKWDVHLAAGVGTHPFLKDGGKFLKPNIFTPATDEAAAYGADVLYQTKNPKIKVGLAASHIRIDHYHLAAWSWVGTTDRTYITDAENITAIMPAVNYSYLIRKKSQLYSQVCAGAAFTTHRYNDKQATIHSINPAFQCTFAGYRLGGRIGAFAELGYGYKGILQLGISGTF